MAARRTEIGDLPYIAAMPGAPSQADAPLPPGGGWRVVEQFPDLDARVTGDTLRWRPPGDFAAAVLLLLSR